MDEVGGMKDVIAPKYLCLYTKLRDPTLRGFFFSLLWMLRNTNIRLRSAWVQRPSRLPCIMTTNEPGNGSFGSGFR